LTKPLFAVRGFTAAVLCASPPNLRCCIPDWFYCKRSDRNFDKFVFKKNHTWSKFDFRFLCEKMHFFTFSTGITQVEDGISKIRSERL
jgi:hypothetical protein